MTYCAWALRSGRGPLLASLLLLMTVLAAAFSKAQTSSRTVVKETPARHVRFSGFDWTVKSSDQPVGPGPNFFSDSAENAWVDDRGYLHLRIRYSDGRWWCAEVICNCSPGFGTYTYRLPAETMRDFDANTVLGLFNWSEEPAFAHREIDFELSTWGRTKNATGNAQFVVQPYDQPDHTSRFHLTAKAPVLVSYSWQPMRVVFSAVTGSGQSLHQFEFQGTVPSPGGNPRINLWLLSQVPKKGTDIHIIVESFSFQGS